MTNTIYHELTDQFEAWQAHIERTTQTHIIPLDASRPLFDLHVGKEYTRTAQTTIASRWEDAWRSDDDRAD